MTADDVLEFGYHLPRYDRYGDPTAWRDLARTAEAAGFDTVWRDDHVVIPTDLRYEEYQFGEPDWARGATPYCDVFTALAHVAGVTDRIGVGTNVCVVPYRHPLVLAKQVLTLVALSEGRFEFGVGVGWLRSEFDALSIPFEERGSRTDEFLDLFERALADGEVAHDGPQYAFDEVSLRPIPDSAHRPRIWVGGRSDAAMRRVARAGDGWTIVATPPDGVAAARDRLETAWTDAGRSGRPPIAVRHGVRFDDGPDPARGDGGTTVGTADDVIRTVAAYVEAGATHVTMRSPCSDLETERAQIERFGNDVIPAVA